MKPLRAALLVGAGLLNACSNDYREGTKYTFAHHTDPLTTTLDTAHDEIRGRYNAAQERSVISGGFEVFKLQSKIGASDTPLIANPLCVQRTDNPDITNILLVLDNVPAHLQSPGHVTIPVASDDLIRYTQGEWHIPLDEVMISPEFRDYLGTL